jgi:hypothetical protein
LSVRNLSKSNEIPYICPTLSPVDTEPTNNLKGHKHRFPL